MMEEVVGPQQERKKTLFGKYEFGKLIGQGNFGRVYHGKNMETGESVAIKMMYKETIRKEGMMEQIKREISVMRLVRHPDIVDLIEVMATKTKIYLVMEYMKGGDLFSKIEKKGRIKEDDARKYFQQLISAVDYCHSRGVSHRDLKLENLLLDERGEQLKVADFGLSALSEERLQSHNNKYGILYTLCGAPAYVAPEVLKDKGYDGFKADIWSCGVILFTLLAGYLPFQDENLMRMYGKIFAGQFDFPPGFPFEAKRLISKIFVVNPEKRISINMIKRVPWILKGYKQSGANGFTDDYKIGKSNDDDLESIFSSHGNHDQQHNNPLPRPNGTISNHPVNGAINGGGNNIPSSSPAFFNAFEFISSMSSGFDLSNLFESKRKAGSMFTSKCSASTIMSKIESMGKSLKCNVSKVKDFKMRLIGPSEGQKGRLLVTAEVFEVAPEVAIVEFSKSAGDTLEYIKFCEEQIRPSLKDIVWTWQGDNKNNNVNITNKFNSSIKVANGYC